MPSLGARQLREVARDLQVAGSPRGLRYRLRRNIVAAVEPMKKQVQQNAAAIPVRGVKSTGLRAAIARATRVSIKSSSRTRNVLVRLMVDAKRMPAGQQSLPVLMEGERRWRHPVYGKTDSWVTQASHPYFAPAIPGHLPGVAAGVEAAVDETARILARG